MSTISNKVGQGGEMVRCSKEQLSNYTLYLKPCEILLKVTIPVTGNKTLLEKTMTKLGKGVKW